MTAVAPAVPAAQDGPAATRVQWHRLTWVTWRRYRAALTTFAAFAGLIAVAMALTGTTLHSQQSRMFEPLSALRLYDLTSTPLVLVLLLLPVLAGLFLGAPLIAREIETGAARFTWAQGADRARWLIATVVPIVGLLAVLAIGLGLEYRWWVTPLLGRNWAWEPQLFGLNPLPFAGWIALGFSAGVFLGAAIRRTVPAMAATFGGYAVLAYLVATRWRLSYLPALHKPAVHSVIQDQGSYGYSLTWTNRNGPGPDVLNTALGWPDGRLLSNGEFNHSSAWFRLHDIQVWLTYQPAGRWVEFQWIEFGWLTVLSALLIAGTVALIRRRAA
jgi:hypothetical protein